jgi:hypothetical protein
MRPLWLQQILRGTFLIGFDRVVGAAKQVASDHALLVRWSSRERGPHAGVQTDSSYEAPLTETT